MSQMRETERVRAYIDRDGVHVPEYADILEDLKGVYRGIYGSDIYLEADSQDGELCAALAMRIHDCNMLAASVYNSFAPSTAQGTGLASVVKVNGIKPHVATASSVDLRVVGQAGTVVNGGKAEDKSGQRWLLPARVEIPPAGEILALARAEAVGDVRAAAGEITKIVTQVRGWQSVENPSDAAPGAPVETDAELRRRQAVSTSIAAMSVFDATRAAVADLTGVTRSRGYENDTAETDGNGLPPHSICMVAAGGDPQEIAATIDRKKGPGCGTYGTTTQTIIDINGLPKNIKFSRARQAMCKVEVTVRPLPGYKAATVATIKLNVLDYLNSLPIGDDVLLSRIYSLAYQGSSELYDTFEVTEARIGRESGSLAPANIIMAFDEYAGITIDNITVKDA